MRRDDYRVTVEDVAWLGTEDPPTQPTLVVANTGDPARLRDRLDTAEDGTLRTGQIDVSFRLVGSIDDAAGVLGVTDRLTGDFVLEADIDEPGADGADVLHFVRAARRYGDVGDAEDGRYTLRLDADDEVLATYEKRTLLVYDADGDLLRDHSLIPGGVEL
ncbi:MAG: DUF5793 family protein [Halobacteriaceae archaeon]